MDTTREGRLLGAVGPLDAGGAVHPADAGRSAESACGVGFGYGSVLRWADPGHAPVQSGLPHALFCPECTAYHGSAGRGLGERSGWSADLELLWPWGGSRCPVRGADPWPY